MTDTDRRLTRVETQAREDAARANAISETLAAVRVTVERIDQRQNEFLDRVGAVERDVSTLRSEAHVCRRECDRNMQAVRVAGDERLADAVATIDKRLDRVEPIARIAAWLGGLLGALALGDYFKVFRP